MPPSFGDLLGFATWCHWRCPRSIVQNLIYWYEDGGRGRGGDLIVRLEGLGRILHESQDLRRFFSAIDHRLSNRPIRNPELAALARILGSCESAASELEPEQASRFLQATGALIAEQNEEIKDRAYKRKFKYALLMLASPATPPKIPFRLSCSGPARREQAHRAVRHSR